MNYDSRKTKSFSSFSGNNKPKDEKSFSYGDKVETDKLIIRYIKGEMVTMEEQYDIFKLDGLIANKYCLKGSNDIRMNQLRKFYDEIVSIYDDYENNKANESKLIRLVPVARYAFARDLIDMKLLQLISDGVEIISKEKDINRKEECLRNFRNLMEAIIAYSKESKEEKRRNQK